MSWKEWFNFRAGKHSAHNLPTREMDSFADNILFELKNATTLAITQALESRESNYMRSILDESFFLLETLVIKALDTQTIKDMESFLSNHEAIDSLFRRKFFSQVLQREYRSKRGATVRVDPDLEPIFEYANHALDEKTNDETFILTLKGRQVRFDAQAVLKGPISKSIPFNNQIDTRNTASSGLAHAVSTSVRSNFQASKCMVHITLQDRKGVTQQIMGLPAMVGREGKRSAKDKGGMGIDVDATYVSRQQLVILEIFGDVFCYVPASASLTLSLDRTSILKPNQLYAIPEGQTLTLQGGIPVNTSEPPANRDQHADFPVLVLRSVQSQSATKDSTPRPKAML